MTLFIVLNANDSRDYRVFGVLPIRNLSTKTTHLGNTPNNLHTNEKLRLSAEKISAGLLSRNDSGFVGGCVRF